MSVTNQQQAKAMNEAAQSTAADTAAETAGDRRLIEQWMPIAALGEESVRERRSMTSLPPTYYLHVWWARRPLVASRAAILASLLPADADRDSFMHILGIHGDPVAAREAMDEARRSGERIENPYTYSRAFSYIPTTNERDWVRQHHRRGTTPTVLDPTAGGGSIPFEAARLGYATIANDLNPVAWLILKATVEFPIKFGPDLIERYEEVAAKWSDRVKERMAGFFPENPDPQTIDATYLWARTVTCPYCGATVPLSPNWRLNNKGVGVRLTPVDREKGDAAAVAVILGGRAATSPSRNGEDSDNAPARYCAFEIVEHTSEQSDGTVKAGKGLCPLPDCGRVISHEEIQQQGQAGEMGEQLYAVVYKEHRITGYTKAGKPKIKKVRGFRAPRPDDDVSKTVERTLAEKMPEWQARGIVPDEQIPEGHKTGDDTGKGTDKPRKVGMLYWRDMFSPRQLLGHCTSVEMFHELVDECGGAGDLSELDKAALTYLAIAIDKIVDWNSFSCTWELTKQRMGHTFARHDFAFRWSFCEMAPTVSGLGYDWVVTAAGKALRELTSLAGHDTRQKPRNGENHFRFNGAKRNDADTPIAITCESADQLSGVEAGSVDAVVIDPPYYDNVMYAELADFFYVWLKRTAGLFFPEQFSTYLTDKDREAVANPAKFKDFTKVKGSGGAHRRSHRDYQERMQAIFEECRRVLKPDGIMTLMFTHKASGAWDALAKGLVEAGFVISASWPVNTEAEGSMHIKDKNAAKSTIFLACRPRPEKDDDGEITYWEDVEPKVRGIVLQRVEEFQRAGIGGVDLYLSCFGPALQVFSENWPMTRGNPAQKPMPAKGAQFKLLEEEEWDPYEVRPEDALMAARASVKQWRLEQIASLQRKAHLDLVTEWFVLAWDAFKSPQFPADEALKLARVVGINFDEVLRGRVLEVKGNDVILWDSGVRAKKGTLGSVSTDNMLDVLHHAANASRERNLGVAKQIIENAELNDDRHLHAALQAMLEVLPTPRMASGKASGVLGGASQDAEALEKLRRLMFQEQVPTPQQWLLFGNDAEGGSDDNAEMSDGG